METLNTQLRAVANEYARQTAQLIGSSAWDWLGNDGTSTVAAFDEEIYLSLDDMQTIIDNMDRMADAPEDADTTDPSSPYRGWLARYGTREDVGKAVVDWVTWLTYGEGDLLTFKNREINVHPRINLRSWLLGLRQTKSEESSWQTEALCAASSILMDQFGGSAELKDVADNLMEELNLKQASLQAELCREIDNAVTAGGALRNNS